MATTRGRKKTEVVQKPAQSMLDAFKFISVAQKKTGDNAHSVMDNGTLTATDGILSAGIIIQENITAYPHTHQMIAALLKCDAELVIAQIESDTLAVSSGDFKGLVPCEPPSGPNWVPDPSCAVISDALKLSLLAAATFTLATTENPNHGAVLLQAGSCVGTDGYAIIEHWHGIDLPPGLLVPRASAMAVAKCKKTLTKFGFSNSSVTFYFEDNSFIKTQLYNAKYPDYARLFVPHALAWDIPPKFFEAVAAINTFSENGTVYFENEIMLSREEEVDATTYKVTGLPDGLVFDCKLLARAKPWFKKAHFDPVAMKVYFYDDLCRGIIMGRQQKAPEVERNFPKPTPIAKVPKVDFPTANGIPNWSEMDDDIPF